MKVEAYLFGVMALFFAVTGAVYAWYALEPAGTAALTVSCLMSALIALYCVRQRRRGGARLQDRKDVPVHEGTGALDFFPPHSYAPVLSALGTALIAAGVIYGVWLAAIGLGVLAPGIAGFVFEFEDRSA